MSAAPERGYWAAHAWLPDGWRSNVLLHVGRDGRWHAVEPDTPAPPPGAQVLPGPALPGLVDAHSHAFQRAFAGLAERRESDHDDFWSWRDRMYGVALRITPALLRAIAAQLYVELLRGGYTQVCEFHYLQHREDGGPYDDPLALAWALADAAGDAGIGLTLLPTLYERAGFTQPALRPEQRRFTLGAEGTWAACRRIGGAGRPRIDAGVAIHSLRGAAPDSIARLRGLADGFAGPIHIHVAEQTAEVDDCLAATGLRPIEWLARQNLLDPRWQLVHATHATTGEIDAVAAAGAGVVLCPTTEANLGDGLPDLPAWLASGVPLALGSDSQVTRAWTEEMRLLEYGQRLTRRARNIAAAPGDGQASTAERLWTRVLAGGSMAAGFERWGLERGARADLLVADLDEPALLGVPAARVLDAAVFSSPVGPWRDVMVAGQWVVREQRHARERDIAADFSSALQTLWGD